MTSYHRSIKARSGQYPHSCSICILTLASMHLNQLTWFSGWSRIANRSTPTYVIQGYVHSDLLYFTQVAHKKCLKFLCATCAFICDVPSYNLFFAQHTQNTQETEQRLYFADQLDPVAIVNELNTGPCTDFQLRVGKYGKNKDSRKLLCHRGRQSRKARGSNTKTSTVLPTSKDEQCSFSFTINRDTTLDRWFIRKSNNHCWEHCGHIRVHRDLQYDTIRQVPKDTLETAQSLINCLIPPSIVGPYIEHDSGKTLSVNSLNWLRYIQY